MKTLYKNSSRIAAAIVGSMVFCSGMAVALTDDARNAPVQEISGLGRFTVTPGGVEYTPVADLGRFEITPTRSHYVADRASR